MMLRRIFLLISLLALSSPCMAGGGPLNVLILVNDNSPDSQIVADHYATARGIPPGNFVYLKTTTDLTIPFKNYVEQIRKPVLQCLRTEGLARQITYIVATQGFPIRVKLPGKGNKFVSLCAALQVIEADLDKIPLLGMGKKIKKNPYFQADKAFSPDLFPNFRIYLSTMLIGFDREDAMALVDRAIKAEKSPPPPGLFLFQDAKGNASSRNRQYDKAVKLIGDQGFRATRIKAGTKMLKGLKPLIAWFSGGSYSNLNRKALQDVKFHPGAIVDMLESFGAVPKNFADDGKFSQFPVTWMIKAGATLVHGAVAEPFSIAFPTAKATVDYLEGYNAADAIFKNTPTFYWMNLLIGDPLCAPYAQKPKFEAGLERLLTKPISGKVTITPTGEHIRRYELYVDGILKSQTNKGGVLTWDTCAYPDGEVLVQVVAVGEAPAAPQATVERKVSLRNSQFRVLSMALSDGKILAGQDDTIMVELSRPSAFPVQSGAILLTGPGGKLLKTTIFQVGSRKLKIASNQPLPASSSFKLLVTPVLKDLDGRPLEREFTFEFRTTASSIILTGPAVVTAGVPTTFIAMAKGSTSPTAPVDKGFTGRLSLSTSDKEGDQPKPTMARAGKASFTMILRTAGKCELQASHTETGLKGTLQVLVKPAEFAKVELQVPEKWIAGNALPVKLVALDNFGNPTPATSPVMRVFIGNDGPHMAQLSSVDQGLSHLLLPSPWVPGDCKIEVFSGSKPVWQGKTSLLPGGLSYWLRLGAFEPKSGKPLACPAAPRNAPTAGSVTAGKIWVPEKPAGKIADLKHNLDWLKENRAGFIATGIMSIEDCAIKLRLGLGGTGCNIYFDGKKVAEVPETRSFRDQAFKLQLKLTPGYHWLGLALTKIAGGPPCFNLTMSGADNGVEPNVCFYPFNPYQDKSNLIISGRIRSGGFGIPKMKIHLVSKQGKIKKCRTSEKGLFVFEGLEPGKYTLKPISRKSNFKPSTMTVFLGKSNAWDQDFLIVDQEKPAVQILAPRPGYRAGRNLNVRIRATDNTGLEVIWFSIDGKELGDKKWNPPYRTLLDLSKLSSGRHRLRVFAKDHSGNITEKSLLFYKR